MFELYQIDFLIAISFFSNSLVCMLLVLNDQSQKIVWSVFHLVYFIVIKRLGEILPRRGASARIKL